MALMVPVVVIWYSSSILPFSLANILHQEYYTEAKLGCDNADNQTSKDLLKVNKYWLMPDGMLLSKAVTTRGKRNIDGNFTLHISKINDGDFGLYYCITVFNDSSINIQRHGLNIDGALFDSLNHSYARRAVVGAIAAASVLVIMLLIYSLYRLRFSKKAIRRKMIVEDLHKGIDRFSTQFYDNVGFELYTKRSSFRKKTWQFASTHGHGSTNILRNSSMYCKFGNFREGFIFPKLCKCEVSWK